MIKTTPYYIVICVLAFSVVFGTHVLAGEVSGTMTAGTARHSSEVSGTVTAGTPTPAPVAGGGLGGTVVGGVASPRSITSVSGGGSGFASGGGNSFSSGSGLTGDTSGGSAGLITLAQSGGNSGETPGAPDAGSAQLESNPILSAATFPESLIDRGAGDQTASVISVSSGWNLWWWLLLALLFILILASMGYAINRKMEDDRYRNN